MQYSLNLHLNNDLNARVFEIMSAGGCLITDRQQPQSGMNALFTEGEHYIGFDGDEELVAAIEWALRHPIASVDIARNANKVFTDSHLPLIRVERFWEHVTGKSDNLIRNLDYEPRVAAAHRSGPVSPQVLVERMRAYEFLQEQVRVRSGVRVFYSSEVDPLTVADSADLSRLHRAYACSPETAPQQWQELAHLGVDRQVHSTTRRAIVEETWDLVVVGVEDFEHPEVVGLLIRLENGRVAVAGNGAPVPPARVYFLAQLGWLPDPEWPSLYKRMPQGVTLAVEPSVASVSPLPRLALDVSDRVEPTAALPVPPVTAIADSRSDLDRAHQIVVEFAWNRVGALLPDSFNGLIQTGVIRSLKVARPVDGSGRPIPGLVHSATDFVEGALDPEWSVHVWGDGTDAAWWAGRVRHLSVIKAEGDSDEGGADLDWPDGVDWQVLDPASDAYARLAKSGTTLDVVVIAGEVPERCVEATLERVAPSGLIIVDNSDRQACAEAVGRLADAGWHRVDFWGILPRYLFRGCTSIFFKDMRYISKRTTPDTHQSAFGPSFAQLTKQ
jgi:hypothetical protein